MHHPKDIVYTTSGKKNNSNGPPRRIDPTTHCTMSGLNTKDIRPVPKGGLCRIQFDSTLCFINIAFCDIKTRLLATAENFCPHCTLQFSSVSFLTCTFRAVIAHACHGHTLQLSTGLSV